MCARHPIAILALAASAALLLPACSEERYDCDAGSADDARIVAAVDVNAPAFDEAGFRAVGVNGDGATAAMIKSAILSEPGLNAVRIDVDVEHAVVTLDGYVENAVLKFRASQIAQSAAGAGFVVDNVVVRSLRKG